MEKAEISVEKFRELMQTGERRDFSSPLLPLLDEYSDEARKLTAELNNSYHTMDEIREIFAKLTGTEKDDTFRMFPPFYTDCGKNIKVGKNVFINAVCALPPHGVLRCYGTRRSCGERRVLGVFKTQSKGL